MPELCFESLAAETGAVDDPIVELQPGARYLHAERPVHELMRFFLTDSAPDRYEMRREDAWIEVRGARGEFRIGALDQGAWTFRRELQRGRAISLAGPCVCSIDHLIAKWFSNSGVDVEATM